MLETGILVCGSPIELLDGFLVYKDRSALGEDPMTIGKGHNTVVQLLGGLQARLAPLRCYLQAQGPITIPPSHEPEPDGAVVRGQPRDYARWHPGPTDVSCVIEVSDSSLYEDRGRKLAIYAKASVPQYLIVNLVDDRLEVFERPDRERGEYESRVVLGRDAEIAILAPGGARVGVSVRELLP